MDGKLLYEKLIELYSTSKAADFFRQDLINNKLLLFADDDSVVKLLMFVCFFFLSAASGNFVEQYKKTKIITKAPHLWNHFGFLLDIYLGIAERYSDKKIFRPPLELKSFTLIFQKYNKI